MRMAVQYVRWRGNGRNMSEYKGTVNGMNQPQLGIKQNMIPFMLLVVLNFFVGSMVGIERTVLPLLGEVSFGLVSTSAALSFIVSFGFSKAIVNYFAGQLADRFSRKRVLQVGWFIGLFVPVLIIVAPAWWVIVVANMLLGINQGLTWSMTVNMKIDLATPEERGTAVGLNEFAGYTGVAVFAALSGYVATTTSIRPEPFYLGIGVALIGIVLSFFVTDTKAFIDTVVQKSSSPSNPSISAKTIFAMSTWKHRALSTISFAGLSTNLKDGMAWGLFPLFFATSGLSLGQIGTIVALYPASWGFFQLFTGVFSDRIGRKGLITYGMWIQGVALWFMLLVNQYAFWLVGAVLLGIGTAMVYPTLQAAISDVAAPQWRASALGVYRFWRDSGYAFGALLAGVFADIFGVNWAIGLVALLPFMAGILVRIRLQETLPIASKNK